MGLTLQGSRKKGKLDRRVGGALFFLCVFCADLRRFGERLRALAHGLVTREKRDVVERDDAMHDDGIERGEHDAGDHRGRDHLGQEVG